MRKPSQAAQKDPDARRCPPAAREAYSLYVERAAKGADWRASEGSARPSDGLTSDDQASEGSARPSDGLTSDDHADGPFSAACHHVAEEAEAEVLLERHDGLGVELHGRERQRRMLDRHDHAVRALRGHHQHRRELLADREERVITPGGELLGEPREDAPAEDSDAGDLAVHRVVEDSQLAAEVLHDALEPQTHAEGWNSATRQLVERPRERKVARRSRPR